MNNVIIHAAYPKTASTWFQENFYPNVRNFQYIKRNLYRQELLFSGNNNIKNSINKLKLKNKNIILCEEGIMNIRYNIYDINNTALKLYNTFPNAQIIFIIRNQINLLESKYSHYIRSGGTADFSDMIEHLFKISKIEQWNYFTQINKYIKLFGEKSIKIFLYEDFKTNQQEFIQNFSQIYNFDINLNNINYDKIKTGLNKNLIPIIRFTNRFSKNIGGYNHPKEKLIVHIPGLYKISKQFYIKINNKLKGDKYTITDKETEKKLINYFMKDNQKLIEKNKLNLIKYNYPL